MKPWRVSGTPGVWSSWNSKTWKGPKPGSTPPNMLPRGRSGKKPPARIWSWSRALSSIPQSPDRSAGFASPDFSGGNNGVIRDVGEEHRAVSDPGPRADAHADGGGHTHPDQGLLANPDLTGHQRR